MKVKLTREKILNTFANLQQLLGKENDYFFNGAIIKNKEKLELMSKKIRKELVQFEEMKNELDNRRVAICKKYAKKDENGIAILINNNYEISEENKEVFEKEIKPILEEGKNLQDKRQNYFEQEVEFEGFSIDSETIPSKMIGAQQEAISPFIVKGKSKNEITIN